MWKLGFACALLFAAPAQAATVTIDMSGTLTSKFDGGFTETQASPIGIGDSITAHLVFNDAYRGTAGGSTAFDLRTYGGSMLIQSGPFSWTGTGDFLDGFPLIDCDAGTPGDCFGIARPMARFVGDAFIGLFTEADSNAYPQTPDIVVNGFAFTFGEYGYDLYNGPNFSGAFDPESVRITVTPVPEPASWAMMIAGFGLAGAALQRRKLDAPRGDVGG
jgi:hypothetical protein